MVIEKPKTRDKSKNTKQDLIEAGIRIIGKSGFNSTGISEVLKEVGVPKGSFYHYFESKDDFGLQMIDYFAETYLGNFRKALSDPSLSPMARLRRYAEDNAAKLESNGYCSGCLMGNMAQELAGQHPAFQARLAEVFTQWQGIIADNFRAAQGAGELSPSIDADELAEFYLMAMEGATLQAKVSKCSRPLRIFLDIFFTRLATPCG